MVYLLLFAGHETTVNLIGNGVLRAAHPPRPAAPGCGPTRTGSAPAVEELLRYDGPVQSASRDRRRAGRIGGVTSRPARSVVISLLAANRDPAAFPTPTGWT